ncbi:DUF2726 domain-containing protein [Marinobacterium sedimentorum]|uniref:DUF2726 domain-containing protein n=1 Tax=Marinobacterium sedimentorum TaxID=2927804 RepID=UPI0020C6BF76|nr:DUF2726 domain-containing protein [Marinobacterium sedimentorum]MCP8688037.1 DUF2726 domain-containing protein [Marinobacterium sedimentorum]
MEVLVLVVLLVLVVVFFLKFLARNRTSSAPADQLQYRRRPALFTPAERSFAGVLDQVLDARYRVYGKVRVADLIEPLPAKDRRIWQKAFNRISAKHFDFVICNSSDLVPVVVIELDDRSHQKAKSQQRDEMLQQICQQVQLPLIRVPAQKGYKLAEVEDYLKPLRDFESTVDFETTGQAAPLRAVRDDTGWAAGV